MTTVEVSTYRYVFAHGQSPRGRGSWAFRPWGSPSYQDWQWFQGTYTEARRQAVAWARENGVGRLEVGS